MQQKTVHPIGLISGLFLIIAILLSFHTPWWQLRVGDLGSVDFSLLTTNMILFGQTFTIPLLMAINISGFLLLSISAIVMMLYSVNPTKDYAKSLLSWSYKQPIIILIGFVGGIVALTQILPILVEPFIPTDMALPIIGTSIIQVPSEILGGGSGVQIGIALTAGFQWTFYLTLAAMVMCIATRILYSRAGFMVQPLAAVVDTPSELT